jgi:SAM-dependent methyltransferase
MFTPVAERNNEFYERTARWLPSGIGARDRQRAELVSSFGSARLRVLELGCGAANSAAAMAALGHHVTAIELSPTRAAIARQHARWVRCGVLEVIQADFNSPVVEEQFDVVCYWSGFGVSEDSTQLRLLNRIRSWLAPDGRALIDVFDPRWWEAAGGRRLEGPQASQELGYDSNTERLNVSYHLSARGETLTESLRCYSVRDFVKLAHEAGLQAANCEIGRFPNLAHLNTVELSKHE